MISVDCAARHKFDAACDRRPEPDRATAGLQLDKLGLTDCLAPTDGEAQVATLSIVAPDELACDRAVQSFAGPCSLLRHQVGHRLWERLVGQSDHVAGFWLVFSDTPLTKQPGALERWAEAFDTYMLILDIAGTAAERGLLVLRGPYDPIALPFAAIFDHALRRTWVRSLLLLVMEVRGRAASASWSTSSPTSTVASRRTANAHASTRSTDHLYGR